MRLDGIWKGIAVPFELVRGSANRGTAAARKSWRCARVSLRHAKRRVARKIHYSWPQVRLWLLKLKVRGINFGGRCLRFFSTALMTLIAIAIAFAFALSRPTVGAGKVLDHIREVNLACAGIAGTALALILTLSIIPAQKAGEAFSQSILKLYVRDRALSRTFILLGLTCIGSLLVGTGWDMGVSPYSVLGLQFLMMGASIDALRYFHTRTIQLLLPETAINLRGGSIRSDSLAAKIS